MDRSVLEVAYTDAIRKDSIWLAKKVALLARLDLHIRTCGDINAIYDMQAANRRILKAITKRFPDGVGEQIIREIQKILGKIEVGD